MLRVHEDALQDQLQTRLNLEEEKALNKRLLKEIQKRDLEKNVLKKIVEQQEIENRLKSNQIT